MKTKDFCFYPVNRNRTRAIIAKYLGNDNYVDIPAVLDGMKVVGIHSWAFLRCDCLVSIVIPESVSKIGSGAFLECENLRFVDVRGKVRKIEETFSGCPSLESITVSPNHPDYFCKDGVLFSKDGKTLIYYPQSKAGTYEIPESVIRLNSNVFSRCYRLTAITVHPDNKNFSSRDGVLFNKDGTVLIYYPPGRKGAYEIPFGARKIEGSAFRFCAGLFAVTIPESVEEIVSYTFSHCRNLVLVIISESVKKIGSGAFEGCTELTSVNIPEGIQVIDYWVFLYCEALESVSIPNSVQVICRGAFCYCKSLVSVRIPEGVKEIEHDAFYGCESLVSVCIPDGIKEIRGGTFRDCTALTSVRIPDSVQEIEISAFANCESLDEASRKAISERRFFEEDRYGFKPDEVADLTLSDIMKWDIREIFRYMTDTIMSECVYVWRRCVYVWRRRVYVWLGRVHLFMGEYEKAFRDNERAQDMKETEEIRLRKGD